MTRVLPLLCLVVALGASLASPAVAGDAAPAAIKRQQALEQHVLAAINETRTRYGLRPLVMSDDLQDAAIAHSRAMLERGFFAHDSPNGAPFSARVRGFYPSAGYNSWAVGENLIYSTEELTADLAITAWLASPSHRENMLTPKWREVGVGSLHAAAARGLFAGSPTWVITVDFGIRSGKVAQRAAPKPMAKYATMSVGGNVTTTKKPARSAQKKTASSPATKSKQIDRVLPRPSRRSDVDGADDGAAGVTNIDDAAKPLEP